MGHISKHEYSIAISTTAICRHVAEPTIQGIHTLHDLWASSRSRTDGSARFQGYESLMKSSFGRHLFFDLVAEGLLIGFGTSSPKLITIDTDVTRVPASDIDALARAICDHTAPG